MSNELERAKQMIEAYDYSNGTPAMFEWMTWFAQAETAALTAERDELNRKNSVLMAAVGGVKSKVENGPQECPHEENYVISGSCPCCGIISELHDIAQAAIEECKNA